MCSETIKQRIADLRARAQHVRTAAQYAERNTDRQRELAEARALEAQADQLARELEQGGAS